MRAPHGLAQDYLDGQLAASEELAFLDHVGGCDACQHALEAGVQLAGLEDELRAATAELVVGSVASPQAAGTAPTSLAAEPNASLAAEPSTSLAASPRTLAAEPSAPLAAEPSAAAPATGSAARLRRDAVPRRRPRWALAGVAVAAAAAAVALVWWGARPGVVREPAIALALGPSRAIEPRLTYPQADQFRPYNVARGGAVLGDDVSSPEIIAALARRGDHRGVATAYLLAGDRRHAAAELAGTTGADAESDRGALAYLDGDLETALVHLDRALEASPMHRQALWNRGLVLRDLNHPLAAAAMFDRVAAGDPAWRAEAEARARELRAQILEWRAAWTAARAAGEAMAGGAAVLTPAIAARFPGIARLFFYDAVRTSDSPARLAELAPLATALDHGSAGGALTAWLTAARGRARDGRAALIAPYRALVDAGEVRDRKAWEAWLAAARHAGAHDLVLGALIATNDAAAHPAYRDEARRLVAATHDPWFAAWLLQAEARWASGDATTLADALGKAVAACDRLGVPYRCLVMADARGAALIDAHRLVEARAVAADVLTRADHTHEWWIRAGALASSAELERLRSHFELAAAHYEELAVAFADCFTQRETALALAEMRVQRLDFPRARSALASAPTCDEPWSLNGLQVAVDLARRDALPAAATAELRRHIAALRDDPGTTGDARRYLDSLDGRLVIDADPAAGRLLLERAIGDHLLDDDSTAAKAQSAAFTTLLVDAARRGAWNELLPLWARETGAPAPARCALLMVADDARLVSVGFDDAGVPHGSYAPDGHHRVPAASAGSELAAESTALIAAPADGALAALARCAEVAVLAQPPLFGVPGVLPAARAWSYRRTGGAAVAGSLARRLVVADPDAPASLGLPRLAGWRLTDEPGTVTLRGADATRDQVRAALADADLIELHTHATVSRELSDVAALVLTADANGRWALTAAEIAALALPRRPLVVLADCGAGDIAPLNHAARGLPTAFLRAGARAVIATPSIVADADAPAFFGAIVQRIARGESPAAAVAAERAAWLGRDPASWVAEVTVFE